MKTGSPGKPLLLIFIVYAACFLFRIIEYLFVRTDQTFLGEAFVHKLAGIIILVLTARYYTISLKDAGFPVKKMWIYILYGFLLGILAFIPAYAVEFYLQNRNEVSALAFYVSSYTISGNKGNQTALIFFSICIAGNILNVLMEEGVFRGLFITLAQRKYTFLKSALLSSMLFGIWHTIGPVRSFLNGDMNAAHACAAAAVLVISSGIVGFKFCLLRDITGSVWMSMADHFVNNTIVNILHVTTSTGADEFMMVRISIAQTISFLIVLCIYLKRRRIYKQQQF